DATLWTVQTFGDAEFIVDCRIDKKSSEAACPTVLLGTRDDPLVTLKLDGCQTDYGRFVITVRGKDVSVESNGKQIGRAEFPKSTPSRRSLGLGGNNADFMNLYVRDL